jgi:hypothetical protein
VHLLHDLDGLSAQAQAFLKRRAWREPCGTDRLSTEFLPFADASGNGSIAAPTELVVRREGFAARFAGLRYKVRRSVVLGGQRLDTIRQWDFDLDDWIRTEPSGWSFGWAGERVSSPVRYLMHTDGRFGVTLGGPFLEVSPSLYHMIEGHALMDKVADWHPVAASALEAWTSGGLDSSMHDQLTDLRLVTEASGSYDRWLHSDTVIVRQFKVWTDSTPRPTGVMAWTRRPIA